MVERPSFSVLVSWPYVHDVHISANVGDTGERKGWLWVLTFM